ncbi:MAG: methyltransferase domain-containing protein [Acidobacteriota bacterium]
MGLLIPADPRNQGPELMDGPSLEPAEIRQNLRDLERFNRYFGGASAILSPLRRLLAGCGRSGPVTILDAGAGGADIPRAIVRWARQSGLPVAIVACDRHPQILEAATEFSAGFPEITFARQNVLDLPCPPGSFAVAICSLMLHHLTDAEAVLLLRKLDEATRLGFIVSDLERTRLAHGGVWLATHLLSRNRLTRHDGPLSVRRAFTLRELRRLGREAGCRHLNCYRRRWFRILGVCAKTTGAAAVVEQRPCGTPS